MTKVKVKKKVVAPEPEIEEADVEETDEEEETEIEASDEQEELEEEVRKKKKKVVAKVGKKVAQNIIGDIEEPDTEDRDDVKSWLKKVDEKLDRLLASEPEGNDEDADDDDDVQEEPVRRKRKVADKPKRGLFYWD